MNSKSTSIICLCLLFSYFTFSQVPNIQQFRPSFLKISGIDITQNSQSIAVGSYDNKSIIYQRVDGKFENFQIETQTYHIEAVDLTDDGKYFLATNREYTATVYSRNQTNRQFEVFQQEKIFVSQFFSGVISNDHQHFWVGDERGNINFLQLKDDEYEQIQVFSPIQSTITYLSLSKNSKFLLVSTEIKDIFLYQIEDNVAKISQTIIRGRFMGDRNQLTDDGMYIVGKGNSSNVVIDKFNPITKKFEPFAQVSLPDNATVLFASLSPNQQFLGISTESYTLLKSNPFNESSKSIKLSPSSLHKFNSKYLVTGNTTGHIKIYSLNSTLNSQVQANDNMEVISINVKLNEENNVKNQQRQSQATTEVPIIGHCVDGGCQKNNQKSLEKEKQENQKQNEQKNQIQTIKTNPNNKFTFKCNLKGCLQCSSPNSCSQCNATGNYYLDFTGKCLFCNESDGKIFTPFSNFGASALSCIDCPVRFCATCQSLQKCKQCETGFVLQGGECFRDEYSAFHGVFIVSLIILIIVLIFIILIFLMMTKIFKNNEANNKENEESPVTAQRMMKEKINENSKKPHM